MSDSYFPLLIEVHATAARMWVASPQDLPIGVGFTVVLCRPNDEQLARILNASELGFFSDDWIFKE